MRTTVRSSSWRNIQGRSYVGVFEMKEHRALLRQTGKLVDQSSQHQLLLALRARTRRDVTIAERDGQQRRNKQGSSPPTGDPKFQSVSSFCHLRFGWSPRSMWAANASCSTVG